LDNLSAKSMFTDESKVYRHKREEQPEEVSCGNEI